MKTFFVFNGKKVEINKPNELQWFEVLNGSKAYKTYVLGTLHTTGEYVHQQLIDAITNADFTKQEIVDIFKMWAEASFKEVLNHIFDEDQTVEEGAYTRARAISEYFVEMQGETDPENEWVKGYRELTDLENRVNPQDYNY